MKVTAARQLFSERYVNATLPIRYTPVERPLKPRITKPVIYRFRKTTHTFVMRSHCVRSDFRRPSREISLATFQVTAP